MQNLTKPKASTRVRNQKGNTCDHDCLYRVPPTANRKQRRGFPLESKEPINNIPTINSIIYEK